MFAGRTYEQGFYKHCIVASCFVVIPWMLNMRQLIKAESKWSNDRTIKERVNTWIIHYNLYLIGLAALSGSAFSAIEICNSQAFGVEIFSMGLTQRHLKAFNGSRLFVALFVFFFLHFCFFVLFIIFFLYTFSFLIDIQL